MPERILAQSLFINNADQGSTELRGPLVGINTLNDLIGVLTSFLYPMATVILLFIIIWGGYDFLMARGEADQVSAGKAKITAGIIGFVLLMLSLIITRIIGFITGTGQGIL
jgi:hypothetical protein